MDHHYNQPLWVVRPVFSKPSVGIFGTVPRFHDAGGGNLVLAANAVISPSAFLCRSRVSCATIYRNILLQ